MTEDLFVETTGETVGEAKWAALRELERQRPGIDRNTVRFEVVSEGERGLLGVGYAPARVVATAADAAVATVSDEPAPDETELAADVRGLVERIVEELGVRGRVVVREEADGLHVDCVGGDAGALIGRYGQTIDAVQYIVNAIVARRGGERVEVTVDAAGYRERRRAMLERIAVRSAERARNEGAPVELEAMTAVERKVVHLRLKEFDGVETSSEGTEPNRYVVVSPT
ncbi:MAG TPA: RNA-binding cell elongation regulator Jag/EloR [Gaiellaceae bacterium]